LAFRSQVTLQYTRISSVSRINTRVCLHNQISQQESPWPKLAEWSSAQSVCGWDFPYALHNAYLSEHGQKFSLTGGDLLFDMSTLHFYIFCFPLIKFNLPLHLLAAIHAINSTFCHHLPPKYVSGYIKQKQSTMKKKYLNILDIDTSLTY